MLSAVTPLPLTRFPAEVLEIIFVHTEEPKELAESCKTFYQISRSAKVRSKWVIQHYRYHALEAAVRDFPRLFGMGSSDNQNQNSAFHKESLDVLLKLYGPLPRYVVGALESKANTELFDYIRSHSANPTDHSWHEDIVEEFGDWFDELYETEKNEEELMQDLEQKLEFYGLPGLGFLSCNDIWPTHDFMFTTFKKRFYIPALYKDFLSYICSQNASPSMVKFLLKKGMPIELPPCLFFDQNNVEAVRELFDITDVLVIEPNKSTYFFGADFVEDSSSISRYQSIKEEKRVLMRKMTKCLAPMDMSSVALALLHQRYNIAKCLLEHDTRRWGTRSGRKSLYHVAVVCNAVANKEGVEVVAKYLGKKETIRATRGSDAMRLSAILEFLECAIDLNVEGAKNVLRYNVKALSKTKFTKQLKCILDDYLQWAREKSKAANWIIPVVSYLPNCLSGIPVEEDFYVSDYILEYRGHYMCDTEDDEDYNNTEDDVDADTEDDTEDDDE